MVFDGYADYYDLLYEDKDYDKEAKYIDGLIKKYHPNAKSILDLGCGTGKHASLLAQMRYEKVHGVDMSYKMLEKAYERGKQQKNLSFFHKNIQDFSLNEKYDVVTALFHVMSYQTIDKDIENVFLSVKQHLNKDGIFIFDCWYGPAVLSELPEVRLKRFENNKINVLRIAEPILMENDDLVDVFYNIIIKNKNNGEIKILKEKHRMRYLFKNNILRIIGGLGFNYINSFEFLGENSISKKTWNACFVIKNEKSGVS